MHLWPVTTSNSSTDTIRHGMNKRKGFIQGRVKISFVLIMGRQATRNALNDRFQLG